MHAIFSYTHIHHSTFFFCSSLSSPSRSPHYLTFNFLYTLHNPNIITVRIQDEINKNKTRHKQQSPRPPWSENLSCCSHFCECGLELFRSRYSHTNYTREATHTLKNLIQVSVNEEGKTPAKQAIYSKWTISVYLFVFHMMYYMDWRLNNLNITIFLPALYKVQSWC